MGQKMCEECGQNPANVHLTQITQDETAVSHLCEKCARDKGINVSISGVEPVETTAAEPATDTECPRCHLKLSVFRKHGRLGCAQCYVAFEKEIDELLVQVHGSCEHKGKRYSCAPPQARETEIVARLRDELHQAIRTEEFELAASIRDKIHSIEIRNTSPQDCGPS
jgi:protein arginine kinase activator